ncbi:MAG: hypothetical protein CMP38_07090 [Rickettsiales bacterium]|nr:hypothetical protein [Rickettsiales bacterium]
MLKLITFFFLVYSFNYKSFSDEIVQDKNGNYFLMKSDGTFEKLSKPKPGNKYIIQKKKIIKKKKKIFNKPEKKARRRTDTGFR